GLASERRRSVGPHGRTRDQRHAKDSDEDQHLGIALLANDPQTARRKRQRQRQGNNDGRHRQGGLLSLRLGCLGGLGLARLLLGLNRIGLHPFFVLLTRRRRDAAARRELAARRLAAQQVLRRLTAARRNALCAECPGCADRTRRSSHLAAR